MTKKFGGKIMKTTKELDKQYVMNTYNRFDLEIAEGIGANCYDENGKEYLDFGSGIGVNCLGYCDLGWISAITKQACKLSHTSNLYYNESCATFAEKLCKKTNYASVFFGNSGAEANEGAIKLARKYSFDKYGQGRNKIITLVNSFHGRTMATLSATGQDVFHNYFQPFLEGFDFAIAGDFDDIQQKADQSVCAIMLEFVQGEGGVVALDKDFVQKVAQLCKEKDILFIADEVQTGVGRTGKFLASQLFDVSPNITTLAKGLGGGLPIGAVLCDENCKRVLGFSMHGSTFGGNPIVCAGASYVVDTITDKFMDEVAEKGIYIRQQLKDCAEIAEVSGLGLMIGIALKTKKAADVVKACMKCGLIMLTAKDRIRLLPPLVISYEEIDKAIALLKANLDESENIKLNEAIKISGGNCSEDCQEELDDEELKKLKEVEELFGSGSDKK